MPGPSAEAEEVGWIRRAQSGDAVAFGFLVERYETRIFSLVAHVVGHQPEVEDLAQDIFVKAWQGVKGYNFQAAFGTWLSRIAINHCYDHLRRQRASRVSYAWQLNEEARKALEFKLANLSGPGSDTEQQLALRDLVEQLLGRASPEDRLVLGLKELNGMSVEEISQVLNLNESTVKVRLHRARRRMVQDLERWQKGG